MIFCGQEGTSKRPKSNTLIIEGKKKNYLRVVDILNGLLSFVNFLVKRRIMLQV